MWNSFNFYFILAGIFKFFSDSLELVGPIILNYILLFMEDTEKPLYYGIILSLLLFLSSLIQSICKRHYYFNCDVVGMFVKSVVITSVYDKSLKLNNESRSKYTTGQINNLISVDVQKLQDFTESAHSIWSVPYQIIVAIILLYMQLKWAAFGGLAVIILTIPVTAFVAKMIKKYQVKMMKINDERVKIVNEMLNGIKIIKLQAWEKSFIDLLSKIRNSQIVYIIKYIIIYK